jgi:hypothetical protein
MHKDPATNGSSACAGDGGRYCADDIASSFRNDIPRLRYALIEITLERKLRQLARSSGRDAPAIHRWPRTRDGSLDIPSLASLQWHVGALQFQLALWRATIGEQKAGYDSGERRVPKHQPGGGEWTAGGASGGSSKPGNASHPVSDNPPEIPEREPASARALNQFVKQSAYWLARAALKEAANPAVGTFLNVLDAANWGYKAYPYIKSYLDPPKTLSELQDAVSNRQIGYDIHHIVEQTSAERDGSPRRIIDASDNLVRIPTLKHWQITGWYMTPNEDYGGRSPREYLRGQNWDEKMLVGRMALIKFGVLAP